MGSPHRHKRGSLKPLCKGCGLIRVKSHQNRYCSLACVPRSVRAEGGRRGRRVYAYRRRAMAYRDDLERLGRTPTREDIIDMLHTVYKRAYNTGYQVAMRASLTNDRHALTRAKARDAA
jgi:hypothetical protein